MAITNISKTSSCCYLYRYFDEQNQLLYVGISLSAINRLAQHKRVADWASLVRRVSIESFESRAAALVAEKKAIRTENPLYNIKGKKSGLSTIKMTVSGGVEQNGEPFLYLTPEVLRFIQSKKAKYLLGAFNFIADHKNVTS